MARPLRTSAAGWTPRFAICYFSTLGVGPARGRVLTPEDDRVPSGHLLLVLEQEPVSPALINFLKDRFIQTNVDGFFK
jgi:hypothetical protein